MAESATATKKDTHAEVEERMLSLMAAARFLRGSVLPARDHDIALIAEERGLIQIRIRSRKLETQIATENVPYVSMTIGMGFVTTPLMLVLTERGCAQIESRMRTPL